MSAGPMSGSHRRQPAQVPAQVPAQAKGGPDQWPPTRARLAPPVPPRYAGEITRRLTEDALLKGLIDQRQVDALRDATATVRAASRYSWVGRFLSLFGLAITADVRDEIAAENLEDLLAREDG